MTDFDYRPLYNLMKHIMCELTLTETNAAAAQRVRTATLDLQKLCKKFRADSIAHHKERKRNKDYIKKKVPSRYKKTQTNKQPDGWDRDDSDREHT